MVLYFVRNEVQRFLYRNSFYKEDNLRFHFIGIPPETDSLETTEEIPGNQPETVVKFTGSRTREDWDEVYSW